ncbi:hypothetical protein VFPPC_18235 [Pochonia chlamydosporia 170]|uniref:Uncharacterized protein n=1 Tax=Pochonia chlamydosporia 170 TaxID=1380566 RepID=A0A219APD7_METCM|nr:hypothetical protein VFPPC_18235 [Pochonia chlamydosporia 170]OWT42623.1 hypothetical protein VFPPC_18235 [Pochonia chlamydosporia 170]
MASRHLDNPSPFLPASNATFSNAFPQALGATHICSHLHRQNRPRDTKGHQATPNDTRGTHIRSQTCPINSTIASTNPPDLSHFTLICPEKVTTSTKKLTPKVSACSRVPFSCLFPFPFWQWPTHVSHSLHASPYQHILFYLSSLSRPYKATGLFSFYSLAFLSVFLASLLIFVFLITPHILTLPTA